MATRKLLEYINASMLLIYTYCKYKHIEAQVNTNVSHVYVCLNAEIELQILGIIEVRSVTL